MSTCSCSPLPIDFEHGFQVIVSDVECSSSSHPSLVGPVRVAGGLGHAWSCLRVFPGLWCVTGMR